MDNITIKNYIAFLNYIGFKLKNGTIDTYSKIYNRNYEIKIIIDTNFKNSQIDFGNLIKMDRKTTCNFSQQENFVVLECINKLLEKGYEPNKIKLEVYCRTGHKGSGGYIDIQVLDKNNNSFLIIECKTYDIEYEKEEKEIIEDGGQLFTYFEKNISTKYLCLYASSFIDSKIEDKIKILVINEDIFDNREKTAFENWDKKIWTRGLFDDVSKPYFLNYENVKKLDKINKSISEGLYNKFAEILRKNAISDKTNAYNKIFNLLLCKVVDEDNVENSGRRFEFKNNDDNISFLGRLNDLYKEGVREYLRLNVTDYSEEEIEEELKLYLGNKDYSELKKIYNEIRLFKNNEFSFIDVYNKETFEKNALIVKEVVELFQNLQFRYEKKQQHLGDFFEELLNTGIKQEEGQYFTPTPITSFISKSLPIGEIIELKNNNKEKNFLPYVIDYACGSGHFLTEIMAEIQKYVDKIDTDYIKGGRIAQNDFNTDKNSFNWAERYIYGIEKDYRLTKTAKVSTLLNGDGLANIFCDDGLNNFSKYKKDYGILYLEEVKEKDNLVFDIVVANPPYSVKNFKDNIKLFGEETFDLYPFIEEKKIECFFIERTKQLLKEGGVAGIILPSSILSNTGLYTKTRELILKYFEIKAIVELGDKTFMKTGTSTIILFLKKVKNNHHKLVFNFLEQAFETKKDITINDIETPISKYLKLNFNLEFEDFKTILDNKPNNKIKELEIYSEYLNEFEKNTEIKKLRSKQELSKEEEKLINEKLINYILNNEKEKIFYFILTYNKKITLVKSPENSNEQKVFLGYEFTERRSDEGIKLYKDDNNNIISKLYDENNLNNNDKVNSYILDSYKDKESNITESMKEIVFHHRLHNLIDFKNIIFEKKINLNTKIKIKTKWDLKEIGLNYEKIDAGTNAPQDNKYFVNGTFQFIRAGNLNHINRKNYLIFDKKNYINTNAIKELNLKLFKKDTILFPKSGKSIETDNICLLNEDSYVVNHLACIYDNDKIKLRFLFYVLKDFKTSNFVNNSSGYPSINLQDIKKFKIPFPPKEIQEKIVREIEQIEDKQLKLEEEVINNEKQISKFITEIYNADKVKLKGKITLINGKFLPQKEIKTGIYSVYGGNGIVGKHNEKLFDKETIVIGRVGENCGAIYLTNKEVWITDNAMYIKNYDTNLIFLPYLAIILEKENLNQYKIKKSQPFINQDIVNNITCPLPAIEKQKEITLKINQIKTQINSNNTQIIELETKKKEILDKYL